MHIHNAYILFGKFNASKVNTEFDFIEMLIFSYLGYREQECVDEFIEHFCLISKPRGRCVI